MNYDELKQHTKLIATRGKVLGELASWAVQQSPYVVPDNLAVVITKFHAAWPIDEYAITENMSVLEDLIRTVGNSIPELLAWNERKNGREGWGFASRYDQPAPDDDFIDLDALYRNIAMSVWKDCVEFAEFNKKFDEQWAAREEALNNPLLGPAPPLQIN